MDFEYIPFYNIGRSFEKIIKGCDVMNNVFAKNLKSLRISKKLTQEQVAEHLCVSPQTVSRWECGNGTPDVMMLPEIARLYCVTIDDLYKKNSIAYENYAARLSSLYEYTRQPEDFIQADLEFRRLFKGENFRDEDKRNYGCIHHFMMNYCKDKAIQLFDEIISNKESVEDEVYYRTRGQKIALLSDIGQNEKNIEDQRKIIERGTEEAREYGFLVGSYYLAGKYQEAYEWYLKSIEKFPEDWSAYVWGGDICRKLKKYDEAFGCWDKALELNDQYFDAKYSKAFCYEELGQYDKAYSIWNEIAEALDKEGLEYETHHARDSAKRCIDRESIK